MHMLADLVELVSGSTPTNVAGLANDTITSIMSEALRATKHWSLPSVRDFATNAAPNPRQAPRDNRL